MFFRKILWQTIHRGIWHITEFVFVLHCPPYLSSALTTNKYLIFYGGLGCGGCGNRRILLMTPATQQRLVNHGMSVCLCVRVWCSQKNSEFSWPFSWRLATSQRTSVPAELQRDRVLVCACEYFTNWLTEKPRTRLVFFNPCRTTLHFQKGVGWLFVWWWCTRQSDLLSDNTPIVSTHPPHFFT